MDDDRSVNRARDNSLKGKNNLDNHKCDDVIVLSNAFGDKQENLLNGEKKTLAPLY